jgi:hypothetical protein
MARWNEDRWVQNEDGSYRRRNASDLEPVDYDSMSKTELVALAESRGLAKSGNKADLVDRLLDADYEA